MNSIFGVKRAKKLEFTNSSIEKGGGTVKKEPKEGRNYIFINIDEPYIKAIYEVLKAGEIAKGTWNEGDISFKDWCERSF